MKAVFHILAILVAGGAVYFSYDHSVKFKAQQATRIETKSQNAQVSAKAASTKKELGTELDTLKKKRDELALIEQKIDGLRSAELALKRESSDLDKVLETQKQEFAQLETALKQLNDILGSIGGGVTMDTLGPTIVELDEKLKTRKAYLEERLTLTTGAESKIVTNKAESKRLTDRVMERNVRINRNSTEAVVTAVNQDWGFLVIGAGSNSGFTPDTELLITRDGKLLGRVRPTSIEPTQTVADINLASLASGVRLQPGDRVILAKPATN